MISEAPPADPAAYYYAEGNPLFAQTTVQAFRDAGAAVSSLDDVVRLGVYLTTAVKCPKAAGRISTPTIKLCSGLLESELGLFPSVAVYLLMGDAAIAALNALAARAGYGRVVPAGSTYKLRRGEYHLDGVRVLPSYLQAGPAYFIEKTKRTMIAEDIRLALALAGAAV